MTDEHAGGWRGAIHGVGGEQADRQTCLQISDGVLEAGGAYIRKREDILKTA
jgi:hypothetical protein